MCKFHSKRECENVMASIEQIGKKKACVIGGTGFVASLLIKQLLEKGYAVNTTVRDPGLSLLVQCHYHCIIITICFFAFFYLNGPFDDKNCRFV